MNIDDQLNIFQNDETFKDALKDCKNEDLKEALEKFRKFLIQSLKFKNVDGKYEKKDFFYEVDPLDISLNPLQEERFEKSKEGKILLFENSKR